MVIGYAWWCASLLRLGRYTEARQVARAMLSEIKTPWRARLGSDPSDYQVMQWLHEVTPLRSSAAMSTLAVDFAGIGLPGLLAEPQLC